MPAFSTYPRYPKSLRSRASTGAGAIAASDAIWIGGGAPNGAATHRGVGIERRSSRCYRAWLHEVACCHRYQYWTGAERRDNCRRCDTIFEIIREASRGFARSSGLRPYSGLGFRLEDGELIPTRARARGNIEEFRFMNGGLL
jgi:hypothetical protein